MKARLRGGLREIRWTLHAAQPDAAERILETFQAVDMPMPAVAAVYRAMGSELDPGPLADWLAAQGARIALPVVLARKSPLIFREAVAGPYVVDALGLLAPPPHAPTLQPSLIFVPLLGFDRTGARLGQGGGYYDRTLAALRAGGAPIRAIGLAYAGQEVARIPIDAFDQRLDGVLTETAYLDFTGDRLIHAS